MGYLPKVETNYAKYSGSTLGTIWYNPDYLFLHGQLPPVDGQQANSAKPTQPAADKPAQSAAQDEFEQIALEIVCA